MPEKDQREQERIQALEFRADLVKRVVSERGIVPPLKYISNRLVGNSPIFHPQAAVAVFPMEHAIMGSLVVPYGSNTDTKFWAGLAKNVRPGVDLDREDESSSYKSIMASISQECARNCLPLAFLLFATGKEDAAPNTLLYTPLNYPPYNALKEIQVASLILSLPDRFQI